MVDSSPTTSSDLNQLFKKKSLLALVNYFCKCGSNEYKLCARNLKYLSENIPKTAFDKNLLLTLTVVKLLFTLTLNLSGPLEVRTKTS